MVVKISADTYIVNTKQLCKNIDGLFDNNVDFELTEHESHIDECLPNIPDVESNMGDFTYNSSDDE